MHPTNDENIVSGRSMAYPILQRTTTEKRSIPAPDLRVVPSGTRVPYLLLDPGFPYGEDLLQFIWEQRLFAPNELRTTDGRSVEVVKPGRIQSNSGPDLAEAQIRIDGQLWAGTVEVHLRSSEWNAHGHQFDPAYDNVALHVVFQHDAEVYTSRGNALPTVELLKRVSMESIEMHLRLMQGKGFVPCAEQLPGVDRGRIGPWLERVLVERLERRTKAVEAIYRQLNGDAEATLYQMLSRAFGSKVNAEPFGMLANALPLRTIQKYRDDLFRTEALLFGQAGLLQVDLVDDYPRSMQQEHVMLAKLHGLRPAPVAAWKFGRMRPMNFPTVRIAQLAQLLNRCNGSFTDLLEEDDVQRIHRSLDLTASEYWTTHYQFDRPSAAKPKRLGRAGADHLIINALVPALFALGRLQGRPSLSDRAMGFLEQLPSESNTLLDGWAELGLLSDTAARGQALLELRNSYCGQRRCLSCVIGAELLKGTDRTTVAGRTP